MTLKAVFTTYEFGERELKAVCFVKINGVREINLTLLQPRSGYHNKDYSYNNKCQQLSLLVLEICREKEWRQTSSALAPLAEGNGIGTSSVHLSGTLRGYHIRLQGSTMLTGHQRQMSRSFTYGNNRILEPVTSRSSYLGIIHKLTFVADKNIIRHLPIRKSIRIKVLPQYYDQYLVKYRLFWPTVLIL